MAAFFFIPAVLLVFIVGGTIVDLIEYFTR